MADHKICRICVRVDAKMYHINQYQLRCFYEELTASKINDQDGLPQYVCYECATLLHKFHKFKEKCYYGQKVLLQLLLSKGYLSYESIHKMDHNKSMLKSPLSLITPSHQVKTFIIKSKRNLKAGNKSIDDENDFSVSDQTQDLSGDDRISDDEVINSDDKLKCDERKTKSDRVQFDDVIVKNDDIGITDNSKVNINSKNDKEKADIKIDDYRITQIDKFKQTNSNGLYSMTLKTLENPDYWIKTMLNDEEAMKVFKAKVEDKKYVTAAFKCEKCFKGFSKKDMLDRHIQLRHIEQRGKFICRFCQYRFRIDCLLKKHMRQHYTRYECKRCELTCSLETTALLHEEYHSGVIKKCRFCDLEFRHASTYYTHLRTHRSEHVCTLCGASFVSNAGLNQHKRIKHVIVEIESPDDDEEVNTYCQRCNIRFETRKAYEEHLFHSALHSDDDTTFENKIIDEDSNSEASENISSSKKILGKRAQAKKTQSLKKNVNEDPFDTKSVPTCKRKKAKYRRKPRKPTTCHQCGEHFETQMACLKHHLEAHPRTSFHPPAARYICEVCGASLAPGSVASHQNIHTKEKLHTCDTCGRQFHAGIGLKRHMLTHTGEKPFGCPLCDKKFTQSNSMKLHYRTFHLKQPYPKRNRSPRKKDVKETVETRGSNSEESSSSYDSRPEDQPHNQSGIEPVTGAVTTRTEDPMDYLTLD